MLHDEVLAMLSEDEIREGIYIAHKFFLTNEYQQFIDLLTRPFIKMAELRPYCRLPFSKIWIENTTNFGKQGALLSEVGENEKYRLRKYLNPEGQSKDISEEYVIYANVFCKDNNDITTYDFLFSPSTLTCHEDDAIEIFVGGSKDNGITSEILTNQALIFCREIAGMNIKNAVHQTECNDLSKLNAARIKQKKYPLLEYKTLTINQDLKEALNEKRGSEAHNTRLHFRRGHFKKRQTGLFWWNPHMAGYKEFGMLEKDYIA